MSRTTVVLALACLFASVSAVGDRPAPESEYSVVSPNGEYEFTMYPATRDGDTSPDPRGEARRVGAEDSAAPLWTVTGWYSFDTFIADDGRSLVRMGPWASLPPAEELAVAFYRDGEELRRYSVADLVKDTGKLPRSVSHYTWQADDDLPTLTAQGEFLLRTLEGTVFRFDVATGDLLAGDAQPETGAVVCCVTRRDVDDRYHAELLFRENRMTIDPDRILDVERRFDTGLALVWVRWEHAGLPVFRKRAGYGFSAAGKVFRDKATGEPSIHRGDREPDPDSFPIDHRPDVTAEAAIETWLAAARADERLGADYAPPAKQQAELGFYNVVRGRGEAAYRLAWQVSVPDSGGFVAIVGAKKGDLLFPDPDAGASTRTKGIPEIAEPELSGVWRGGPCGARRFARRLILESDGTFRVVDRGEITFQGTWSTPRSITVELDEEGRASRRSVPLAPDLDFDVHTGTLHEVTPGSPGLCTYSRIAEAG